MQERTRSGAGAALGRGVTLQTHDFECVGKAGKEGGGGKSEAAAAAADVPVAPKLDLVRMRARAGGEGGSVTDRAINRVFQVIMHIFVKLLCRLQLVNPPGSVLRHHPSRCPVRGRVLPNCTHARACCCRALRL